MCPSTLPKQVGDRYPTSRYSVFEVKSVSGQICGQKFFAEHEDGGKARKREKNGDFASFRRSAHEAVTRSQTTRATNCATPRFITHLLYHTDHEMSTFFHSNIWKRAKNSAETIFVLALSSRHLVVVPCKNQIIAVRTCFVRKVSDICLILVVGTAGTI